jgi:hypothetical protein
MATLTINGTARPSNVKHPSAPVIMNSHFASVGDNALPESYDHGIQVIDEDKTFKCVPAHAHASASAACPSC